MQKELLDALIVQIKAVTGIGDVKRWRNQFEHANKVAADGSPRSDIPSIKYPACYIGFIESDPEELTRGEQLIKDQVVCLHIGYKNMDDNDNGDLDLKQEIYYVVQGFKTTHWNTMSRFKEEWDEDMNNLKYMKMYFRCSARDKSANRPKKTHLVDPVTPVNDSSLNITNDVIRTDVPL